jgi:hypothetical protein
MPRLPLPFTKTGCRAARVWTTIPSPPPGELAAPLAPLKGR